jgi:putative ABC transport system permease protein
MFTVLKANAMLGRTFAAEEGVDRRGSRGHLSRAFWERHYGGSPSVLGRTIQPRCAAYTIVGVMPAEFDFPAERQHRRLDAVELRPGRCARPLAQGALAQASSDRLADNTTLDQAQREMSIVASRLATTYPDSNTGWGARVISAQEQLVTTVRPRCC